MYVLNCKCGTKVELPDHIYEKQSKNWSSTVRDGLCMGCIRDAEYVYVEPYKIKTGKKK